VNEASPRGEHDTGAHASIGRRGRRRTLVRVALAIAMLALVLAYARPVAVLDTLRGVHAPTFLLALTVAIASNLVSALRWAAIARAMGLHAPTESLVAAYAQGMAANTVLPGAILGGDVLRGYALHRLGNPLQESALSVLVDRASGLWVLCALSLGAVLGIGAAQGAGYSVATHVRSRELAGAALLLALACVLPLLAVRRRGAPGASALALAWARRTHRVAAALAQLRPALPGLLLLSVVVQVLSAAALWLYARSIGAQVSLPIALAAAAPIFVMAALPVGYAGFGTRELAAVAVLGVAGVPAAAAASTGLLYGIGGVLQGVVGAAFFVVGTGEQRPREESLPVRPPGP
jgi:uncharacterized membrane protein YbhN (UPF0104 family)